MSAPAQNGPRWKGNAFGRAVSKEPSPVPSNTNLNRSAVFVSSTGQSQPGYSRHQSFSPASSTSTLARVDSTHRRTTSQRNNTPSTATFAPQFIKSEEIQNGHVVNRIEGESDFSGKRYVWLKDPKNAFVRGWVVQDLPEGRLLVQCDDNSQRNVHEEETDKVNPAKFDKADDMAELTHLNEASVIHNLRMRYQADLIYTYSGLFLVTINPYCPLPIYSREYISMYRGRSREDTKPHIFAMADEAFRNLVEEGKNQSILVTGESGAGKTENTKKVIQYLAAVATSDTPRAAKSGGRQLSNLSEQILRANPILEAFGNAQTSRNNNSSRFGKFIRVQFTRSGQIAGAFIDWYLLEKSRVVKLNAQERNYHIFYQLLRGADARMKQAFLLRDCDIADFEYTRQGNDSIAGVSDRDEWNSLIEAFHIMGFSEQEQTGILRAVAAILHLGNIEVRKESIRADQAALDEKSEKQAAKVCQLLGIDADAFIQALLHPKVKAGRELVEKVQTPEQVRLAINALAKGIYERGFGNLVDRINRQLDRGFGSDDSQFIGVLDIAGFEIFQDNSFEQLCINYTNEKLQQFFNHHMFVLEQEEYAREQIEWKFIDFGKDLQPTIDLIELPNPIGVFSCLDEDSVMPKATDDTFTEKLHGLWDRKTPKYRRSLLTKGFILTHYAAEVEYSTDGWLEKNKDPLPDNITRMLAKSTDQHVAQLFADCADPDDETGGMRSRVKKGLFRTVAQRHKEQLSTLMNQLHQTHPHFVRCILPNHKKKPKQFSAPLVLDQLRCNGVLEGIRIARTGFPNRIPFAEFRQRYEVLCHDMPKAYLEGQVAAQLMLEKLNMERSLYRVGLTKVFFRAGVLAELEDRRDKLITTIMSRFQSVARGFVQRRKAYKQLHRTEATRIVQHSFRAYQQLQGNPWWRLFVRMKPLLGASRQAQEMKKRDEAIMGLQQQIQREAEEKQRLDEERRRAEGEIHRVQHILESERALALDKEEIFKRLQYRETELSEKLADAIEDQEHLEDQLDALLNAKKHSEDQAVDRQKELERAGAMIATLEAEKQKLGGELLHLEAKLGELETARSLRSVEEEKLEQEIKMLSSQLSLKERKLQDMEMKMLKTDQELDVKLAESVRDLSASKKRIQELVSENQQIRQQMSELSTTSTSFEDLLRRKESELAVLRSEIRKAEANRQTFEDEKGLLISKCEALQSRLRDTQAEIHGLTTQKKQLEQDVANAKRALEEKITNDQGRKQLEQQISELREELIQVQKDLSRERQSRDDVEMLSSHKYKTLKAEFDTMNEAKITIEKEMYAQQDVLRRATETKATMDRERKELQNELRTLREKYIKLQEDRLEAESAAERNLAKAATERQALLRKEIDAKNKQLAELDAERAKLADQVQGLSRIIADSESFRMRHDQEKARLERELVTVKGRLTASENDNRALLNKVQQKNLDIARSNSRASEGARVRVTQLTAEKAKYEDENKKLQRQLEDVQLTVSSLEKQKEKLELSLEDLNHEITREHKTSRNAEKVSSTVNLQLAETNRKLETELQLRTQAQANTRTAQCLLDEANKQIAEHHSQLAVLRSLFDPSASVRQVRSPDSSESTNPTAVKVSDLVTKVEEGQHALRIATERCAQMETQLQDLRSRYGEDLAALDARHTDSKRMILEEMNQNQVNSRQLESPRRAFENRKPFSPVTTPSAQRHISNATNTSARSDRTVDTVSMNTRMDLAAELELVQNQLQMSEMRNKHLQSQLDRSPQRRNWEDESPSVRRMQKLERENNRLNDMLDNSAKKISSLEHSLHSGHLSLKEVQTKSHEELFELINSQEQARKQLAQAHTNAINDLADVKGAHDTAVAAKSSVEVELRNIREDLKNLSYEREQEGARHAQLLQEFSDLQIRLDGESGKLIDAQSSSSLYKSRADDYFSKLEQAEISVLRATRAEKFAKQQAAEAEEAHATILSERKAVDGHIEDLQRQAQQYEERIEDLSADLEGALQAKKRLQNDLEDYRSQRAMDIEDKDMSFEHTRKKYQHELSSLSTELELEREAVLTAREENTRLRDEVEELRSHWDDEVLNSTSWSKEKQRLEVMLQELGASRDEAVSAHNEAQSKVVNLLSQVRGLRSDVDDAVADRDNLRKEKKTLESRLADTKTRLNDLASDSASSTDIKFAATLNAELLTLKAKFEQQEDVLSVAVGKMRRAEALAQETQKDMQGERENNVQLHKEKAALEKGMKELQLRLIDAETKGASSAGQDVRFLHGRIQELEKAIDASESQLKADQRSVRTVDRTVKDLQSQVERKEKQAQLLSEDLNKSRDKVSSLLKTIDELQSSDSSSQLSAKRAERALAEEREKCLRLERELEGWKGLRLERQSHKGTGLLAPVAPGSRAGSEVGSVRRREGSVTPVAFGASRLSSPAPDANAGASDLAKDNLVNKTIRRVSLTKGFL